MVLQVAHSYGFLPEAVEMRKSERGLSPSPPFSFGRCDMPDAGQRACVLPTYDQCISPEYEMPIFEDHQVPPEPVPDNDPLPDEKPAPDDEPVPDHHPMAEISCEK
jgi:hypothetical protein